MQPPAGLGDSPALPAGDYRTDDLPVALGNEQSVLIMSEEVVDRQSSSGRLRVPQPRPRPQLQHYSRLAPLAGAYPHFESYSCAEATRRLMSSTEPRCTS